MRVGEWFRYRAKGSGIGYRVFGYRGLGLGFRG